MTTTINVRAREPGHCDGHRRVGEVFPMTFPAPPRTTGDFPGWVVPVGWEPDDGVGGGAVPLEQALARLDPAIDAHWTKTDGLPDLNALAEMAGRRVKRGDVVAIAPDLARDTAPALAGGGAEGGGGSGGAGEA